VSYGIALAFTQSGNERTFFGGDLKTASEASLPDSGYEKL
jgi:hypothetical protein